MCGNYTVTDEVWFEVEVKDMDGPGQDFKGRFTIALFGQVAPMTVMNFVSITRGHKKGGVSTCNFNVEQPPFLFSSSAPRTDVRATVKLTTALSIHKFKWQVFEADIS